VLQTGLLGSVQSLFFAHPSHVSVLVLQTGFGLEHCVLDLHATHVFRVVSQIVPPVQSESFRHCTHAPVPVSQTPIEQSVLDLQPEHVSLDVSHAGLLPVHADLLPLVHCTHWPANEPWLSHAGVAPEQSLAAHARHALVPVSQIGVPPLQSALVVQPVFPPGPVATQLF
jgi:hypothetical protein